MVLPLAMLAPVPCPHNVVVRLAHRALRYRVGCLSGGVPGALVLRSVQGVKLGGESSKWSESSTSRIDHLQIIQIMNYLDRLAPRLPSLLRGFVQDLRM